MGFRLISGSLLVLIFEVSVFAQTQSEVVKITTKPASILVESGAGQKFVNFDFELENQTSNKLKIDSVQLSVFDSKGNFVLRKVIDSHGVSPSINTLPKIDLGPKETLNVFNPFYSFDRGTDLSRMDFDLGLTDEKGDGSYHQKIR